MNLENIKKLAYKNMPNRKAHLFRETGYIYYHGFSIVPPVVKT